MASPSAENAMSDFGHLPPSVAMVDNGDLSLSPTNPLQTSYSTTSVSASLHELVKDISTLAARLCWVKWADHEQNPIDDLVDPLGYVTIAIILFESEEMTSNKDFREPLFGEFKALLSCSKNAMALMETMEEGQTPNVRKNDEIK